VLTTGDQKRVQGKIIFCFFMNIHENYIKLSEKGVSLSKVADLLFSRIQNLKQNILKGAYLAKVLDFAEESDQISKKKVFACQKSRKRFSFFFLKFSIIRKFQINYRKNL
jgi:hypothetical protein